MCLRFITAVNAEDPAKSKNAPLHVVELHRHMAARFLLALRHARVIPAQLFSVLDLQRAYCAMVSFPPTETTTVWQLGAHE